MPRSACFCLRDVCCAPDFAVLALSATAGAAYRSPLSGVVPPIHISHFAAELGRRYTDFRVLDD